MVVLGEASLASATACQLAGVGRAAGGNGGFASDDGRIPGRILFSDAVPLRDGCNFLSRLGPSSFGSGADGTDAGTPNWSVLGGPMGDTEDDEARLRRSTVPLSRFVSMT